jgi:ubiquitin-protein ligase
MKLRGSTFYFCSDGGYFNAIMTFPQNYPNSPPSVRFTSEMWHPNGKHRYHVLSTIWSCQSSDNSFCFEFSVYPDGRVCISILHPPGEDPNGYELASERWTPVHTVGLVQSYYYLLFNSYNYSCILWCVCALFFFCVRPCLDTNTSTSTEVHTKLSNTDELRRIYGYPNKPRVYVTIWLCVYVSLSLAKILQLIFFMYTLAHYFLFTSV